MASKITYDDKVSLTTSALPRANKCTDADLNEIKEVVNNNADELELNTIEIENLSDALNNRLNYSTTEQKIGTWIDGKPIYRRVVTTTTGDTSGQWKVITSDTHVNKLINISGYMLADTIRALPFSSPYQSVWFDINADGNVRVATQGDNFSNKTMEVCLEYTKTTDL